MIISWRGARRRTWVSNRKCSATVLTFTSDEATPIVYVNVRPQFQECDGVNGAKQCESHWSWIHFDYATSHISNINYYQAQIYLWVSNWKWLGSILSKTNCRREAARLGSIQFVPRWWNNSKTFSITLPHNMSNTLTNSFSTHKVNNMWTFISRNKKKTISNKWF